MNPTVKLQDLVKSFRTANGVDLTIAAGETVALLGPNGAGKSTTVYMLLGLTRPDAGEVTILGGTPAAVVEAGAVAAMPQTGALIRDNVRELVEVVASLYPAPLGVDETLELVGITALAKRRTQKLSGGETQRVRFALALVANPQLLVLDEPTTAMDVEGRHAFWTTMRAFAADGKTVLFATHYLDEADAFADRAVLMAHGRVVADGPTTPLKAVVGARTLRATLRRPDEAALAGLPGIATVELRGDSVSLGCIDSDAAVCALLARFPQASDIEIVGAGLEEAFLQLTREDEVAAA
jgi:ABC-2 type transport system ATP-binding protein